jgi:hypothetical protein
MVYKTFMTAQSTPYQVRVMQVQVSEWPGIAEFAIEADVRLKPQAAVSPAAAGTRLDPGQLSSAILHDSVVK